MDGHTGHGKPQRRFGTLRWSLGGAFVGLVIVAAIVLSRTGEVVNVGHLEACLQRAGWVRSIGSEMTAEEPVGSSAIGLKEEVLMEEESSAHSVAVGYRRRDEDRPPAVLYWRGSPDRASHTRALCESAAGAPARGEA